MKIDVNIVNAFVDAENGGNPAGVVLNADRFSQKQKQEIATLTNLSETAFVSESQTETYKVEFFTPTMQIPHCGHATVAAFSFLESQNILQEGTYSKESIDGNRTVIVKDHLVFMEQLAPIYDSVLSFSDEVLKALGVTQNDIFFMPLKVNTGNNFVVIGVKSVDILASIKPNQESLRGISEQLDLVGFYLFTLETHHKERDATTRMFAPRYGISEEAATGMAAGPLACMLYDKLNMKKSRFLIEQGHFMSPVSPSVLDVRLEIKAGQINSLMAGGAAAFHKKLQIQTA